MTNESDSLMVASVPEFPYGGQPVPVSPTLRAVPDLPPSTVTHTTEAYAVVVRTPIKPTQEMSWTWWTVDALDEDEWDALSGWYQVGFFLRVPVLLRAEPGSDNRPRPGPIEFYRGVSYGMGKFWGGQALSEYQNPAVTHPHPMEVRERAFTLGELGKMTMTPAERGRAGGRARTPAATQARRENFAKANEVHRAAAAERYAKIRSYLDAGMTLRQIALVEDISYEGAKKLVQRAKSKGSGPESQA